MRVVAWAGMVAAGLLGPARCATAQEFDAKALDEKAVRSCVLLTVAQKDRTTYSIGTLIDADQRLVLTSAGRLDGADTVSALFPLRAKDGALVTDRRAYQKVVTDGKALTGKVRHRDATRDLAVLQLDKLPPDAQALPVARKSVRVGEPVLKVSNPAGIDWVFLTRLGNVRGVGAGDQAGLPEGDVRRKLRLIRDINAMSQEAGAGGPLVDRRGYLVGVVEPGGDNAAFNLSLDVTEVRAFLKENKVTIKELADEAADPAPKK